MSNLQFLTIVKKVADKHGIEVRVNLKHHAVGFVGNYNTENRDACAKELDEIFKNAGTIQIGRAFYGEKPGNC